MGFMQHLQQRTIKVYKSFKRKGKDSVSVGAVIEEKQARKITMTIKNKTK